MATVDITSTQSWAVPTGVTSIDAICIGRGGNGSAGTGNRGGGGGGAKSTTTSIAVTPSESLSATVGAVTALARGGTTLISANAGSNGTALAAGAGGTTGGVGAVKIAGSAGTYGLGGGAGGKAGDGIAPCGATAPNPGDNGNVYGGGGAGNNEINPAGTGAGGLIRISYTDPTLNGSLASAFAELSLAATGTIPRQGLATVTLSDAFTSATGALAITGSLSGSLDAATLVSQGLNGIGTGSVNLTLDTATLSATGTNATQGALTATLADALLTASSAIAISWHLVISPPPGWSTGAVSVGIFDDAIFDPAIFDTGTTVTTWSEVTRPPPAWTNEN